MASAVYGLQPGDAGKPENAINGYDLRSVTTDHGATIAVYVNADNAAIIAFEGTDPFSPKDWWNNIFQVVGLPSRQYKDAIGAVQDAQRQYSSLSFTGHSAGGGRAIAASAITGGQAVTFGTAAVNPATVRRLGGRLSNADVVSYNGTFDVMRAVNVFTPGNVPGRSQSAGGTGLHSVGGYCRATSAC